MGGGLADQVITAYNAPFPDGSYQAAIRGFAAGKDDAGMWRHSRAVWKKNRDYRRRGGGGIDVFMAHGTRDRMLSNQSAMDLFRDLISKSVDPTLGTAMECGGILWVPDAAHFVPESPSIRWVIQKALQYFGDIPRDSLQSEWMLSRKGDDRRRKIRNGVLSR